jgi:hypothetical protein
VDELTFVRVSRNLTVCNRHVEYETCDGRQPIEIGPTLSPHVDSARPGSGAASPMLANGNLRDAEHGEPAGAGGASCSPAMS